MSLYYLKVIGHEISFFHFLIAYGTVCLLETLRPIEEEQTRRERELDKENKQDLPGKLGGKEQELPNGVTPERKVRGKEKDSDLRHFRF